MSGPAARPWGVALGSAAALSVAAAPLVLSTGGLFIKPVSEEFGWDRGAITSAFLISGLLSALSLPLVGHLVDRWGIRRVVPVGVVLLALNLVAVAMVPGILAVYLVLLGLIGLTGSAQNPVSYIKTISRWFDRRRGLAIGVAVSGMAIGQALVPQYAQAVLSTWGWRAAYLALAVLAVVVALPAVLGWVRDPRIGAAPAGAGVATGLAPVGAEVRTVLRSRTFWVLAASTVLVAMTIQGSLLHVVPLLTDLGWSPAAAASTLLAAGAASVIGRIGGGVLYDRFHAPIVGAMVFTLASGGILLLAFGRAPLIGVALLGLAAGAETDLVSFLASRYFGLRSLAQLLGYLFALYGLGTAVGPFALGLAFDINGDYTVGLVVFAVALLVAAMLLLFLPRRFPFAAQTDDPVPEAGAHAGVGPVLSETRGEHR